ncbi:V-type ATPase 116kDa subunit family protein [Dactylosporangium sp. NPDC005555]|uniref:V-type ATPase 116kDa subunit family protein n=1 Tax=Dactylosporangium sp. NPDC005555 TaxID=3154889 RepID=UPI0033ACC8A0
MTAGGTRAADPDGSWGTALHHRLRPVRMLRVALVAPQQSLDAVLTEVGAAGVLELEPVDAPAGRDGGAAEVRDIEVRDITSMRDGAVLDHGVAAYCGWCPASARALLTARIAPLGGALVPLPVPRGVDPPTLLAPGGALQRSFAPLVETYGTVPYADVDPTLIAGIAYIVMFGMMFGDAGHGLLLLAFAALLRLRPPRRFARLRRMWPFAAGAGLASMVFGLLFGEVFGPTGLVAPLWLAPLDEPVRLLGAGVALGAILLAVAYAVGVVNRWREGSAGFALYAASGVAGAAVFAGLGGAAAGVYLGSVAAASAGAVVAAVGLALAAAGLHAGAGGGGAAMVQTLVQLFDLVIRLGANLVSFARLAAFGMTHAALGALVWSGTTGLWHRGGTWVVVAAVVFVAGNAITFGLEALVAGVQALRLEYYELFTRVFEGTGRAFRPWRGEPGPKEVSS